MGVKPASPLTGAHWPRDAYPRDALSERVLQFGTGMLLRAIVAAAADQANRARAFNGRIVLVQSTAGGNAGAVNAQDGLFTLVEQGLEDGRPVRRTRLVGSLSRALVADREWPAVLEVAVRPELRVIVSNVTEAGFRLDATTRFPARLTELLHARFTCLPDGPPLFVIPTELVEDNGPRLAAMVDELAGSVARAGEFRSWLTSHVRFCSSLVDRITTGAPPAEQRAELEARLGYADALLTVTEPHCFWAVEEDPASLREAFAVDAPPAVVFEPDIAFYRERKLKLLNGAHTALAPLALLAGVPTVRAAAEHSRLGPFLEEVLLEEIVPGTDLPADAAEPFAREVLNRFRNPWLEHPWRVIASNQTTKMRVRVAPSVAGFVARRGRVPRRLALACAAYLRWARCVARPAETEGAGWWRGGTYAIADGDLQRITGHWWSVDPDHARGAVPAAVLERLAARALADADLWGRDLAALPDLLRTTTRSLVLLEEAGVEAALDECSRAA